MTWLKGTIRRVFIQPPGRLENMGDGPGCAIPLSETGCGSQKVIVRALIATVTPPITMGEPVTVIVWPTCRS